MPFRVREATQDDSPSVVGVVRAVFDEYGFTWDAEGYHADLYDLERHYFALGHRFFVAEEGESKGIVGTIALHLFPTLPGPPGQPAMYGGRLRIAGCDCSLDRLYVLPEARRRGIGHALCQRVVEAARTEGRRRMEIWSDKRFLDAHRLYTRLGAKRVADRILDDPDQSPEWGLVLEL